jgi:hypothetical protein
MARRHELLSGSPYFFLGRRPIREARLRAYVVREHRLGRSLSEILGDPYVQRCGTPGFCTAVIYSPKTIELLDANVRDAIRASGGD